MSCLVEDTGGEQRVTFLYKLAPGPCPKSFGINVARLAQLPDSVRTDRGPASLTFTITPNPLLLGHRTASMDCRFWPRFFVVSTLLYLTS